VLLIACPCALGLATPLAVWHALGAAAREGIIIRSGDALERLASARAIFFDKTGTLTASPPALSGIQAAGPAESNRVLALAAGIETISGHPLARSIAAAARERGLPAGTARNFKVHPGVGVEGEVSLPGEPFVPVAVGGPEMLRRLGVTAPVSRSGGEPDPSGLAASVSPEVYVVVEGRISAILSFDEKLRPGAADAIAALGKEGIAVEVLSGDSPAAASRLGALLGVAVRGGLSPRDKLDIIAERESRRGPVVMVGDGINDAPALARAGISITLQGGADLARDASEISLLRDDFTLIPWLVRLARRTHRAIRLNLFWAFSYNVVLIPLAMAGHMQPVLAALAMIGSSLLVVTNSMNAGGDAARAGEVGTPPEKIEVLRVAGAAAG
jgi:cation transport ATPase